MKETRPVVAHSRDVNDPAALDLREAYDRGRKDERARRKRHPLLMTLTFIAAIVGVIVVALAAVNGSFGGAGKVVDQNLTVAADKAAPVVKNAADDASRTVRNATSNDARPTDRPS
jgi:hypothetical protein